MVADIARKNGYTDIVFLDDNEALTRCSSYRVAGTVKSAPKYSDKDFIVAIGNSKIRQKLQNALISEALNVVTLIHPAAIIGENVSIGIGTIVMAGAVVNPCVTVGDGCIINTCASVDHDCSIGDYSHISIGAHVAGTVTINEHTWIGAGATVINNVEITDNCMIGAGAVVVQNISEVGTYVGIPAKKIK